MLKEMRKIDEYDMEKFGTLYRSEKTIAIEGDTWWPQTTKQEGGKTSNKLKYVIYGQNGMNAQMLAGVY